MSEITLNSAQSNDWCISTKDKFSVFEMCDDCILVHTENERKSG